MFTAVLHKTGLYTYSLQDCTRADSTHSLQYCARPNSTHMHCKIAQDQTLHIVTAVLHKTRLYTYSLQYCTRPDSTHIHCSIAQDQTLHDSIVSPSGQSRGGHISKDGSVRIESCSPSTGAPIVAFCRRQDDQSALPAEQTLQHHGRRHTENKRSKAVAQSEHACCMKPRSCAIHRASKSHAFV